MTVKDFVEMTGGIDEFEVFGEDFFECYEDYQENRLIDRYGEKEIVSLDFYQAIGTIIATIYLIPKKNYFQKSC